MATVTRENIGLLTDKLTVNVTKEDYYPEFENDKIVWIEISDRANYCLDTNKHYLTNSAYFLTGSNLKYLLALLNSKLIDFYFYQKTAQIAGGRKRYTKSSIPASSSQSFAGETSSRSILSRSIPRFHLDQR